MPYFKNWIYQQAVSPDEDEIFYPNKDKVIFFKNCTPEDIQNNRGVCNYDFGIYLIEFPSQKTTKITDVKGHIRNLRIFNNHIVWLDNRDIVSKLGFNVGKWGPENEHADEFAWDVYLFDLESQQETKITSYSAKRDNLMIYNNIIVWTEENPDNYRDKAIYAYDLNTNQIVFKDTATGNKEGLSLYENLLVWADSRKGENTGCENCYDNQFDIYSYDFNKKGGKVLVESSYLKSHPSLYQNNLVWSDYRSDEPGIYIMDLNTQEQRRLTTTELFGDEPQIYKDKVVWTISSACDVMPQPTDTGVYLYDLRTKQTERLTDYVEPTANLYDGIVVIKESCWFSGSEYGIATN